MEEPIAEISVRLQGSGRRYGDDRDAAGGDAQKTLHDTIQAAFGWEDCHVYAFDVDGTEYGEPHPDYAPNRQSRRADTMRLERLVDSGQRRLVYLYDFGDRWEHDVRWALERALTEWCKAPMAASTIDRLIGRLKSAEAELDVRVEPNEQQTRDDHRGAVAAGPGEAVKRGLGGLLRVRDLRPRRRVRARGGPARGAHQARGRDDIYTPGCGAGGERPPRRGSSARSSAPRCSDRSCRPTSAARVRSATTSD